MEQLATSDIMCKHICVFIGATKTDVYILQKNVTCHFSTCNTYELSGEDFTCLSYCAIHTVCKGICSNDFIPIYSITIH